MRTATAYLRKHAFTITLVVILLGIAFSAGWWTNELGGDPNRRLVESAYETIAGQSIFNRQTGTELAYAAVRGMLATIDDPYAELIEPEAAKNLVSTFNGQMGVVGLYAENKDRRVVVSIVFPGGAAEAAGLLPGDEILAIDGSALDQASDSSETGLLLRGAPGSSVQITIRRGDEVLEFRLARKEQQFATWKMLPGQVGYIALSAYNQTASQQMQRALVELLQQQPQALVWDLRNNEGGDMQAAQQILSYFIEDGLLFTAELTGGRSMAFEAKGGALAPDLPLVVLVDHTTYSAAETSAAAIAKTGRGKTVGQTTYGKGVIQATMPLPGDTMLQMTVARWLAPDGAWYHEAGVPPMITAQDDPATEADEVLEKALHTLREP